MDVDTKRLIVVAIGICVIAICGTIMFISNTLPHVCPKCGEAMVQEK